MTTIMAMEVPKEAKIIARVLFGKLENALVVDCGRVYFFHRDALFPMARDGRIGKKSHRLPYYGATANIIDPSTLGIREENFVWEV